MTRAVNEFRPAFRARAVIRPAILVVFSALIVAGKFDDFSSFGVLHYSLLALLLVSILFEIVSLAEQGRDDPKGMFVLGTWIILATRVAIQPTGAMDSFLYPLAYLFFAVLVSVVGLGYGSVLWIFFMGLEAGWLAVSGEGMTGVYPAVLHGVFLAAFGLVVGGFVHLERGGRLKAQRVLGQLRSDVSEFQKDDTVHRLSGLTEGGRQQESLRSVFALDHAFSAALSAGREMLEADTLALYWKSEEGDDFSLREIDSKEKSINTGGLVSPGQGLLGWVAEHERSVRASGKRVRGSIPYYHGGVKAEHVIAAPVFAHDKVQGILAADRSGENSFTEEEDKLITALCHQVREIHGNALLMRRAEAEASRFKSLAELSHRLSRTLDLEEIMEAVIRTSRAITGHDAAAVVLGRAGPEPSIRVTGTGGEMDPKTVGELVTLDDSLAGWAIRENQHLLVPDLARRTKKTPALDQRIDPRAMNSLLVQPLPFSRDDLGALVFFARAPGAFSEYVIRATGILADLAAVSIKNAFLYQEMEKKAITDGLTGLYNHRWFQQQLSHEIERAGRLGNRVALALADLDHFKRINDTFGHPMGDEVLKAVADVMKNSIRKVDNAARYGGEEIVLILVGSDNRGARELAERIRKKVAKLLFHAEGREFEVTLSVGVAVYPDDADEKDKLIECADQSLYRAKQAGRNRVVSYSQIDPRVER